MQINPYIVFNGNCREAFEYYKLHLGGTDLYLLSHGDTPMGDNVTEDWKDKIIHATLQIGKSCIMGSDSPREDYIPPAGSYIMLAVDTVVEAEAAFEALARNGQIKMPISETFWSVRYGIVVDQFGIPWMINCSIAAQNS